MTSLVAFSKIETFHRSSLKHFFPISHELRGKNIYIYINKSGPTESTDLTYNCLDPNIIQYLVGVFLICFFVTLECRFSIAVIQIHMYVLCLEARACFVVSKSIELKVSSSVL